jgi:hypothetical protein
MRFRSHRIAKAIALFLTLSMLHICVQATGASPGRIGKRAINGSQGPIQTAGILSTSGNKSIIVDGNPVNPGATIPSGAQLQIPDGVTATVDLGPLGSVDFTANTEAVLTYTDTEINVKLRRGCATVRTKKDEVKGIVVNPEGITEETDTAKKKRRANLCAALVTAPSVSGGQGASFGVIGGVLAGIAAIIVGVVLGTRDNNDNDNAMQPQIPISPSR